jgi:hypothetical protein
MDGKKIDRRSGYVTVDLKLSIAERPLAGKGISLVAKKGKYGCLKSIVGFPSGARAN